VGVSWWAPGRVEVLIGKVRTHVFRGDIWGNDLLPRTRGMNTHLRANDAG